MSQYYRLHCKYQSGTSAGYQFFGDKRAAEHVRAVWLKDGEETEAEHSAEIDVIEVTPTKKGIMAALNRYAKHADNG